MIFSAGNVLVLFIVFVILAIYRQLDRNNRSLEKVKRFAERVQTDLDSIVERKATEIKDMGIELEVHQRAAREVLKRIQTLEDGLSKRAEQIENIGNRIGDYDTALDELLRMTDRAQENIGRIKDESEYIDTVGKRLKQSQSRMDEIGTRIPELVTEFARHNAAELEKLEQSVFHRADERLETITASLESVGYRIGEFEDSVATARAAGERIADAAMADLERVAQQKVDLVEQKGEDAKKALERYAGKFAKVEQDYEGRLEKIAARGEKMETTALEKLKEHIKNRVQAVSEELTATITEKHKESEAHIKDVRLVMQNGTSAMNSWQSEIDTLREKATAEMAALRDRLIGSSQQVEEQVLVAVESRIHEFEEAISYRVKKIETVTEDIDNLEAALRESMHGVEARLSAEFEAFGSGLDTRRQQDQQAAEAVFEHLKGQMGELETGLNELKQRAYENVSEKLQGFEDEFFTDLRDRSVSIERRLDESQNELRTRLAELEERYIAERDSVEVEYRDELRSRLSDFQQLFQTRFETTVRKMESLEADLAQHFAGWEQELSAFQQTAKTELQATGEGARRQFQEELNRQVAAIGGDIDKFERGVQTRVQEIDQSVGARVQEISTRLDDVKSEAALFQAKIDQQLKSVAEDLDQQWGDFRSRISVDITEFSTEMRDRRERIGTQVGELESRLAVVRTEMDGRVDESLVRFRGQYDEMERQLSARAAEIQDESEEISREITNLVHQTRDQFSGMQQKLFGRLQDETRIVSVNLEEIEKRQKQFVEQTRIFERADSMKVSLEQNVDDLKNEINRVEQMRAEIHELDSQIVKLRKSAVDASEKMARFVAEKRRIDALEDDFRRLIGMSQSVETRLEQVTGSSDELQAIQAQLRNLEQMQRDTEESFSRMEKKRGIIDVTTDGIDKSFQQLQELENRLETVDGRLSEVPKKLDGVSDTVRQLLSNRKEADAAVKQLENLDTVLRDIEGRMEQLTTAREWLARTETRLEEVGREAQEQVKLLGTLMKDNGKGEKSEKGAPTLSARDTVVKLARQGWKAEEISRATKVSRGEVELILELAGNR